MEIALGVLGISMACLLLGLAPFEATMGLLLLTPIAAFPIASMLGPGPLPYAIAAAALMVSATFLGGHRVRREELRNAPTALIPVLFFITCFSLFSYLCHLWPDFFQMGERLRDYALLAGVIRSPIDAQEPWLAGETLNYYLYWYRFGHFLYTVFGLPTWEVYHQLQSFTFALFASSIFVLLRRYAGLPGWAALAAALAICLGSNVEGVKHFLTANDYWWGPSRVIPGAINEFPAWSFLLGDAHPHYLNLGLPPFLILIFLGAVNSSRSIARTLVIAWSVLFVGTLLIYNANAWEVPVWVGSSALFFALFLLSIPRTSLVVLLRDKLDMSGFLSPSCILIICLTIYLCASLGMSALNIVPANMPLKLVADPIARTSTLDLLRHWGIPLTLLYLACLYRIGKPEWYVCGVFAIAAVLFSGSALSLLVIVFALNAYRLIAIERARGQLGAQRIVFETLGLVALLLIIFPEIAFFDDNYGGENERMNTIFKAYSAAWFMLHVFVFYLATTIPWGSIRLTMYSPCTAALLVAGILWTGFFFRVVKLRKQNDFTVIPYAQGLSDINRKFPGSATTIQILMNSRRGTVLEAQGPAYDYTTHIATLSGQPAYLGWANHVNLLLRMYDEVNRRTEITNQIYKEPDCAKKISLMATEDIKYVVVGPLEKRAYPGISLESFACLKNVAKAGEYNVFSN